MQLALDHLIDHIEFRLVCPGMIFLPQEEGIYVVVLISHGGKRRANSPLPVLKGVLHNRQSIHQSIHPSILQVSITIHSTTNSPVVSLIVVEPAEGVDTSKPIGHLCEGF